MKETAKKVLKTGFGLGLLSLAEAKKVASTLKKDLDLSEEESIRFAKELMRSSKKAGDEVLKKVGFHLENAIVKSKLASKSELKVVKNVLTRRVKRAVKAVVKKPASKPAKKGKARKKK